MHYTVLLFKTDEEVTPHLFARRVAQACGNAHAMRPGEEVKTTTGTGWRIIETVKVDMGFPFLVEENIEEVTL